MKDDDETEPQEPIVVPLEDWLDLHAFRPADIASVVEEYIEQARQSGLREVRLVHGKGIGAQREIVRALLARHSGVVGFTDAPAERGGWGATVVRLVSPQPERDGD